MRYALAGFATLGTRQSRVVEVAGESAAVDATRSFAAAPRAVIVEIPLEVLLDAQAYRVAAPSYLVPGARRFGLSRFSCLGTLHSRHGTIEGAGGTLAATRVLVAAARHGAIEGAEGTIVATRVLVAAARHGAIEGVGGTIAATRVLVTATRHGVIEGAEGTLAATRDPLVAADRIAEVEVMGGALDAQAYLVAAPSYLVPGMQRFGLSRFSVLGTLQSRDGTIEGAAATLAATRDPLVAADRLAAIAAAGGYLAGRSYAVPDVSGGGLGGIRGGVSRMIDIRFKRGSTLPVYQITLSRQDSPDIPLPLAGATVRLFAKSRLTGATVINKSLEILDATTGLCRFTRQADEFHGGEICQAEIIVTFGNGAVLILPTRGYYTLTIEDSLA